ncbi:cell surface A33 antigen-like [Lampris incognitus]|uniref:cell surface A33 antigen-like n=1 Tax=Lampris incognitus TaxID=2546036 RepID=UPI0024B60403|nr:cell surface A33 antigen-like [Lampris incognitus]
MKEEGIISTKLFFTLTALSCCRGLQVSVPQQEYEVARGQDVTLTCSFVPASPDFSNLVLTWEALTVNEDPVRLVATYFLNSPADIAPQYEGKASLTVDVNRGESSLVLRQVTQQDSRSYECRVLIPNDNEGTTFAVTSLLVLVAPSTPVCQIQGTAEYWHDITLTCVSEEGSPTPTYKWTPYSFQGIRRPLPPRATEKGGALSLVNISMETSGYYICTSTNRIGSASYNLTLSVMPPNMNMGSTAGIIGGVLAGILVLAVVIYCCCRKRANKAKHARESPETVEYHDKAPGEAENQYWDDKSKVQSLPAVELQNLSQEKDAPQQSKYRENGDGPAGYEDGQHGYDIRKERHEGQGSDVDQRRGSRDRLDDSGRYGGSRDRLDDRGRYGGSRDHLDNSGRYGGSRDHLDNSGRYGGSRDHLDNSGRYGGSRDHLDNSGRYGGSRDRLDDRGRYSGSRERLDV